MGIVGEACASCELVLEGVVGEASEPWNKDPVVMPLTWDMVSERVATSPPVSLGSSPGDSPPPGLPWVQASACAPFHLAGSCSNGGCMEIHSCLWLCLFVRGPL